MGQEEIAVYVNNVAKIRSSYENCNYPGFKIKQLLELPRHLEAPKLWNSVIKAQHFQPNQEDQDHFFDRIAENFVVLFLLVPIEAKDTFFFQVNEHLYTVLFLFWYVYPDCLSQVIYVMFCEAFPESIKNFDDDFKDGLVDLIFQWISGLKPRKCVWKKWNLESFKASTVNPNSEGATANIRACGSARSAAACDRAMELSLGSPSLEIFKSPVDMVAGNLL
ncbi:protein FAM227B [Mergus octosetaceus]